MVVLKDHLLKIVKDYYRGTVNERSIDFSDFDKFIDLLPKFKKDYNEFNNSYDFNKFNSVDINFESGLCNYAKEIHNIDIYSICKGFMNVLNPGKDSYVFYKNDTGAFLECFSKAKKSIELRIELIDRIIKYVEDYEG